MKQEISLDEFTGGMSANTKQGLANSFAYLKNLEIRKDPNVLTLKPKPTKDSGNTVTDLIVDSVRVDNGDTYFIGNTGNFYLRTAAGVWSLIGDVDTSATSVVYREDTDTIYIIGEAGISTYNPISGTPALSTNKFATVKDQSLTGGAQTYTTPVAISETATNLQTFTPEAEPLYSIKLKVVAKGTGDWTVTVHDALNNVICSKTLLNIFINNNPAVTAFIMTTQGRMLVKPNARDYHFHVTSTVADGTLQTTTVNDLETADFETWANRMVDLGSDGLHPAIQFMQYLCVCNERYLIVFEPISETPSKLEFASHKLVFPPGYKGCGIALYQEFIAVACEKRSSDSTSDFQEGKIFFWDGTAGTYNYFIDIPEGSPHSLSNDKDTLYWIVNGQLYGYAGGKPSKIRNMPNIDGEFSNTNYYHRNFHNMVTNRKGVLLIGFPSETNNPNVEFGVYSYGSQDKNYPNSFSYDFQLSHGKTKFVTNPLKIGMVETFNEDTFISWRDNATYGVDIINNSSAPAATGELHTLIFDNGMVFKEKLALRFVVSTKALPANCTVTPKYKIDRAASWTLGTAYPAGTEECKLIIGKRFKEIQLGFDVTATTITPEILAITFIFDDLKEESYV